MICGVIAITERDLCENTPIDFAALIADMLLFPLLSRCFPGVNSAVIAATKPKKAVNYRELRRMMEPDRDWNSGNGGKTRLGAAPRIKRRHATSIFGRFGLGLREHSGGRS